MQWECEECGEPIETMSEHELICWNCGMVLCFSCWQSHELECEEKPEDESEE
jgi:hypothetical protein